MEDYYQNQPINDVAWNASVPCNNYVTFEETPLLTDYGQRILPFVDLHEIVTDPPRPIRGIGWYLKQGSASSNQLSLRIF